MSQDLLTQLAEYGGYCEKRQGSVEADEVIGRVVPLAAPVRPTRPRRGWLGAVAAAVAVLALGLLTFLTREAPPEAPVLSQPSPSPTVAAPAPLPSTPIPFSEELDSSRWCEAPSTWSRVCDEAAGFGGAAMWSVTAGGPGMVAVGGEDLVYYTRGDSRPENSGDADAVVWTSPDGVSWSRVPHDEAVFGGDGSQQMFSVSVGGPGLVAVGRNGPAVAGEGDAAVWTSPDGFTWSRVPHDEAIFGGDGEQRMVSVTAGGPGLVAVGFDAPAGNEEGNAAVWTSPDGITWSRVPHDEAIFGGRSEQKMLSVTVGGPGLVAVGSDGPSGGRFDASAVDAAVWTSPDGVTWSRVPHDEAIFGGDGEQRMVSVTAGGPGLVAVGSVSGEIDGVNPGRENSDAAVWTSPDGVTWSRVPHDMAVFGVSLDEGGTGEEQMLSVTAGGSGLVAVGFTGFDEWGWDATVWTSPDGLNWTLAPQPSDFHPGVNGYDRMQSVTIGGSGLVAVGTDHGGSDLVAAVWND